jgi:hypothetical protein
LLVATYQFEGWSLSGASSRSAVNAGLGQFALSGDGTALLLTGSNHTEGERPKPVVEVLSLDSGKRLSLESWQPGAVATDPVAGRGYVYAGTHIRVSGMWVRLGSIEPDGIQTANSDTPLTGAQCAFFGGVVANLSGDIAAVVVMGDFVSRQYNILFLIYSRQFGRWSRAIIRSYPAPELSNGQCRPEAVIRPLGVFTGGTADGWVAWHTIWADSQGVHLADIDSQTVRRREIQINLPAGTTALSAAQVPNGYLLALSGAPTERLDSTIGAAFMRPSGEVAAYQPLTYSEMLAQPTVQPYQAGTAALAAAIDGHTAALAYVTKGGHAKVRFFSNDCR